MCAKMTRERAEEFGAAWKGRRFGHQLLRRERRLPCVGRTRRTWQKLCWQGQHPLWCASFLRSLSRRQIRKSEKWLQPATLGRSNGTSSLPTLTARKYEPPAAIFCGSLMTRWQSRTLFENNADRAGKPTVGCSQVA